MTRWNETGKFTAWQIAGVFLSGVAYGLLGALLFLNAWGSFR